MRHLYVKTKVTILKIRGNKLKIKVFKDFICRYKRCTKHCWYQFAFKS